VALCVLSVPGFADRPTVQAVVVKVTPGELVVDHPTLINLGFEWVIQLRRVRERSETRRQRSQQGATGLQSGGIRLWPQGGVSAVDRGVVLPNVTDGFAGQAPDLGALELGQAPPHCGPRL
jgi:hypothetical protein